MDRIRTKAPRALLSRAALIFLAAAILIGGGVTLASIDFSTQRVDRTTLSIATVQRGAMEVRVAANGRLLPRQIEQIAAQVPGRVAKSEIRPGAVVQVGQVLVELSNPQLIASAEEAQSAWEGAIAELQAAEADLQSNMMNQEVVLTQVRFNAEKAQARTDSDEALAQSGLISGIELKRSRLDLAQLRATQDIEAGRLQKVRGNIQVQLSVRRSRVAQLSRSLERARAQVRDLRVIAGISGVVQAIAVEVGEQLQPGSPIGRIARQDQLYAELQVPAREATAVQVGQRVTIDTRSGFVDGVVTRIDPGVTDGTVVVDVDPVAPLPAGTRPQLQIEAAIFIAQLPGTLHVTRPSYVKSDAAFTVYRLDPSGRYATRVQVRAGKVTLNSMQVLSGLNAGDRIITSEVGEWQDQERILLK